MKKVLLCLVLSAVTVTSSVAQLQQQPVNVPSPTAFSFTQFGNISASAYTGAVQASVPVYTLRYKDFSMPIGLNHVTTGVRIDQIPGWVGTNWNLNVGGVITRQVRGLTDEFDFYVTHAGYLQNDGWYPNGFLNNMSGSIQNGYFSSMRNNFQPFFKYMGDHKWRRVPQRPLPYLGSYFVEETVAWSADGYDAVNPHWQGEGIKDYHPDLFSFNVLDLSGTFEYGLEDGQGLNIKVQANRNIKVERFTEFLKVPFAPETPMGGGDEIQFYNNWSPWYQMNAYPKVISGFKITDDRGYVFYFGKNAEMLDNPAITDPTFEYYNDIAIEYSIDKERIRFDYWKADAWYLTRIKLPDGKKIDFNYTRGQNIYGSVNNSFSLISVPPSVSSTSGSSVSAEVKSPVYLTNVNSDLLRMDLYSSIADTISINDFPVAAFPKDQRRYRRLDSIAIKPYNAPKLLYRFTYVKDPSNRLFLKNFCESGATSGSFNSCYSFDYNSLSSLPPVLSSKTDHWGYFNNTFANIYSFNGDPDTYYNLRTTNAAVVGAGTLQKITYPTGGFTEFEYEPNAISKVVRDKSYEGTYDTTNTVVGGVRIKKIYNGDGITAKKLFKEYFYVQNFLPTLTETQIASRTSTGILAYRPKYIWTATVQTMDSVWLNAHLLNNHIVTNKQVQFRSSSAINVLLEDSHVGYSSVVEKNADGAYTVYNFTNHLTNPDDTAGMEYANFIVSPYYKRSSKAMERGLLSSVQRYTNSGTLVQQDNIAYTPDHRNADGSLPHYVAYDAQALETVDVGGVNHYFFVTGTKYNIYKHNMLESSNASTLYENGNAVIRLVLSYYDNPVHKKVTRMVAVNSTGDSIKTYLKYPQDYPNTFLVQRMLEKGYAGTVIEKIQTIKKNGSTDEIVTGAELNELNMGCSSTPCAPLLRRTYKLTINGTVLLSALSATQPDTYSWDDVWPKDSRYRAQTQFLKYDAYDNPSLVQLSDGTYVYTITGGKGKRVIAQNKLGQFGGGGCSYTSFEEEISADGLNTVMEDNQDWRWLRTSTSTDVFSGSMSLVGEASSKVDISPSAIFILAKTGGAAPTLHNVIDAYGTLGPSISTGTALKTIGIWTLYRFSYAAIGKIGIKSNGNVMDELRLYPLGSDAKAFMTTYTYGNGLISTATDENYKRMFYEYDDRGRLTFIRDDNKNILKRFCYSYSGQTLPCGIFED